MDLFIQKWGEKAGQVPPNYYPILLSDLGFLQL
jgi:hypothetical protein